MTSDDPELVHIRKSKKKKELILLDAQLQKERSIVFKNLMDAGMPLEQALSNSKLKDTEE